MEVAGSAAISFVVKIVRSGETSGRPTGCDRSIIGRGMLSAHGSTPTPRLCSVL
jgi:hypothetical protein